MTVLVIRRHVGHHSDPRGRRASREPARPPLTSFRQVRAVHHADVVEVQPVPGVRVVLGQRGRDGTVAGALVPAAAVAGLAVTAAVTEDAARPAPEPPVPVLRHNVGQAGPGLQRPASPGQRVRRILRGRYPDGLGDPVDERHPVGPGRHSGAGGRAGGGAGAGEPEAEAGPARLAVAAPLEEGPDEECRAGAAGVAAAWLTAAARTSAAGAGPAPG